MSRKKSRRPSIVNSIALGERIQRFFIYNTTLLLEFYAMSTYDFCKFLRSALLPDMIRSLQGTKSIWRL